MPGVKRLVAPEKQRRPFLWIECRTQPGQRLFGPVLRGALMRHPQIEALERDEHAVRVLEATGIDAVEPDGKSFTEGGARLLGRANEVGDRIAARLHDAAAHPAHPPRMLDAILVAESQIAGNV